MAKMVDVTMVHRQDIYNDPGTRIGRGAAPRFAGNNKASQIVFVAKVQNLQDKPLSGIKGVFRVYDETGVEGLRIPFETSTTEFSLKKGQIGYTAGKELHQLTNYASDLYPPLSVIWLKNPKNLTYVFASTAYIFSDGSSVTPSVKLEPIGSEVPK